MSDNVNKYIAARWERTMNLVKAPDQREAAKLLTEICVRYTEPHRFYHTLEHLQACFQVLDTEMSKLAGGGSIELALWFHDIVYNTSGKDNEELSAQLAERWIVRLGLDAGFAQQVGNLVRATTHVNEPGQREAKVLLDVDTSILSASPEEFDKYERDIRNEYQWVPSTQFKVGRTKVLEGFLSREWIYATPEFRNGPREGLARANLERSIARLKSY